MAVGFCRSCGNVCERMVCATCEAARRQQAPGSEPRRCASCDLPVASIYRVCYACAARTYRSAEQRRRQR